jgi:hypothetical protein
LTKWAIIYEHGIQTSEQISIKIDLHQIKKQIIELLVALRYKELKGSNFFKLPIVLAPLITISHQLGSSSLFNTT